MGRYERDVMMSDQGTDFVKQLEGTGFFDQVGNLQSSLVKLSADIATIGEQATQRLDEVESMAAHVMAIEAVLAVILKTHPVDAAAVKAEVTERTRAFNDEPDGSPSVQAVAQDIIGANQP